MTDPILIDAAKITEAQELFADFLATNPGTSIEMVRRPSGGQLGIRNPWGEEGLVIFIPKEPNDLAAALNNLVLPAPFTGIWHRDSNNFEIIWTAFPLTENSKELPGRKFIFHFEGVEHECEFTDSSDRLLALAEYAIPVGVSETQHRNLQSFHMYMRWRREVKGKDNAEEWPGNPISFWIRNFAWDETKAIRLVKHLNFYMTYFDYASPFALIWPSAIEAAKPRLRYIRGHFPTRIDAHEIGDDVLQFWSACTSGDTARKFVYYYRIIEHSSYTYVERDVRIKTRRLLSAPDALSDVSRLADQVIGVTLGSEMDDGARIAALLNDAVDPNLLWEEITRNRRAFEEQTTFDGGYIVKPLITKDDTALSFANNGLARFATLTRGIRNHLSHGRDRTTLTSITPTTENFERLKPWVGAISVVAGEVMTHRGGLIGP